MERSYALMEQIIGYPLQESREPFATIADALEADGVEAQFSRRKSPAASSGCSTFARA